MRRKFKKVCSYLLLAAIANANKKTRQAVRTARFGFPWAANIATNFVRLPFEFECTNSHRCLFSLLDLRTFPIRLALKEKSFYLCYLMSVMIVRFDDSGRLKMIRAD